LYFSTARKRPVVAKFRSPNSAIRACSGEKLGNVRRFCAFEVHKQGPLYGKFEVICIIDEGRDACYENESFAPCWRAMEWCYAWRTGGLDASAPPAAVVRCILRGQCAPSLAETLPEPARSEAVAELKRYLEVYLHLGEAPRAVRRFPLEVVKATLGAPTYEEAEEAWRRALEERRRARERAEEEERRRLEEAKRRKAAEVEEAVRGPPVRVSVGRNIYVRTLRELSEEETRRGAQQARA